MSLIFLLSTRQRIAVSDVHLVNFVIFKSFHVIEYAVLFILNYRAFALTYTKARPRDVAAAAALLSFNFGVADEIHQMFVPTRQGSLRDGIIDGIGIVFAWYTLAHLLPRMPKPLVTLARRWHVKY